MFIEFRRLLQNYAAALVIHYPPLPPLATKKKSTPKNARSQKPFHGFSIDHEQYIKAKLIIKGKRFDHRCAMHCNSVH